MLAPPRPQELSPHSRPPSSPAGWHEAPLPLEFRSLVRTEPGSGVSSKRLCRLFEISRVCLSLALPDSKTRKARALLGFIRFDMHTVKDGISVPLNNPRKSVRLGNPGHLPPGWGTAEIKHGPLEPYPLQRALARINGRVFGGTYEASMGKFIEWSNANTTSIKRIYARQRCS